MFETKDNRAWAIIIVFAIVIGYFSLSWAGVVPDDYNIVTHYFSNDIEDDNTTITQDIDYSEVTINGIPDVVDVSDGNIHTYEISFTATEGMCEDMTIMLDVMNSMTNATIELSQGTNPYESWSFAPDGYSAQYVGAGLVPFETVSVKLTISGDEFTRQGSVMVICSSNGRTHANEGLITIIS